MAIADLFDVYDLFFPSPPRLMEMAAMEIAFSLCRREIQQHITKKDTLRECLEKTTLKAAIPNLGLPLKTLPLIERYVIKLEEEIPIWVQHHTELDIPKFELKHFANFVSDFDGGIHYRRTAERFVTCKEIGNDAKFRMACNYCLETEIYRIWPKVSSHMTRRKLSFRLDNGLLYWVSYLRNTLHEIKARLPRNASSIEEFILEPIGEYCDWSTMEYYLNRLPLDSAMQHMSLVAELIESVNSYDFQIGKQEHVFYRHILGKLNEKELEKFLNEKGEGFIFLSRPSFVLNVWAYIKNKITKDAFCRLVQQIMIKQSRNSSREDDTFYLYEIWITAPDYLKQAAIQNVLCNVVGFYISRNYSSDESEVGARRSVSFLLAMLSDSPIEVRKRFWNEQWSIIIIGIRPTDLYDLAKLCFNNDADQINLFKEEALSENHDEILRHLKKLLEKGFFEEFEEFLMFWYSKKETIKELKRLLL